MIGHIAHACHNKKRYNAEKSTDKRPREVRGRRFKQELKVHYCSSRVAEKSDEEQPLSLYHVQGEDGEERKPPYQARMDLNGEPVTFEVDTGSGFTILNQRTFREKVKHARPLKRIHLGLRTYNKKRIKVLRKTYVRVNYKMQERILPIIVVKGRGPNLLGRWWLKHVKIDWAEIKSHVQHEA